METLTKKWDWAQWEPANARTFFKEICGVEGCSVPSDWNAIAEDSDDAGCIRSRCNAHFNRQTQKSWLKSWRAKHLPKEE